MSQEQQVTEVLRWYRDSGVRCLVGCAPRVCAGVGLVHDLGDGHVFLSDDGGKTGTNIPLRHATKVRPYDDDASSDAPWWEAA